MLEVRNLHAKIGDKEILKGIDLVINDGETHAIMGPNGSGKSTLSAVLVGNPLYEVTEGEAYFNGKNLLEMIRPQYVHVLYKGRIVKTGGPELAVQIQEHGYDWIKEEIGEE